MSSVHELREKISQTDEKRPKKVEICSRTQPNLDELEFVKLKIPILIPSKLIELVKGKTFTVEQFYEYQSKQLGNPNNHLYVLVDKTKKIHGFLWAETQSLDGSLFVNTFSVDRKFWGGGEAIKKAVEFLDKLHRLTTNWRYFEKNGFARSKIVLLEYNSEKQKKVNYGTK